MRHLRLDARSTTLSVNALLLGLIFGCADGTAEGPEATSAGGSAGTSLTGGTAGAPATGGTVASGGSSGTTSGTGGTGGATAAGATGGSTGGAVSGSGGTTVAGAGGTGGSVPVDCSGIDEAGFDLCESGNDGCTAVFTDGAGCTAVCAAAGLSCTAAYDNADGCSALSGGAELPCDSGHESDYCVCGGEPVSGSGGSSNTGGTSTTGGTGGTGTGGTGGTSTTGGTGGTGTGGTGGSNVGGSSGTGPQPDVGPAPCGCESSSGEYGTISQSIVVRSGEVFDGECQTVRADPNALGDGTQAEGQDAVFVIEDGGTLRNVLLGASAADGVHIEGDATLENVHWLDIGEDAMTIEGSGTVTLNCGSATNGDDKVFQINAETTLNISNFTASNAGKFIRQNGETTFEINVTIDHSDISNMGEVIFRTDSSSSHVTLTNSRYSDIADGLFMFGSSVVDGNSDQSTVSNNAEY
jgi:hypothetical protein